MERYVQEDILLNRLARGDQEAFRILYDRHRDKLFFYILKITRSQQVAEDVLQEVFVKIWLDRERMEGINNLTAWLFRMVKNRTINALRRQAHENQILTEIGAQQYEVVDQTTEAINFNETQKVLQVAIQQLPPQQQLVYRLQREQGLKNDEIAHQLNISPLTVKKHISQAARSIRGIMEQYTAISVIITLMVTCL